MAAILNTKTNSHILNKIPIKLVVIRKDAVDRSIFFISKAYVIETKNILLSMYM